MKDFDRWLTTDPREEDQARFEGWCDANGVDPEDADALERYEAWVDDTFD